MRYTYVIPCYNSEQTIKIVIKEIDDTMQKENVATNDYEIILVNDYSKDNTGSVINDLSNTHNNITAIQFAKNFGQDSALLAGYHYAKGDIVITLDDDGQTPANEVMTLVNKINEGYDVVFGKYAHKHHSKFRNFGSKVNDFMACKLIGKPKDLYLCSYFAAKKFVIDEIIQYDNPYPYMIGLLLRTTSNMCNVPINHRDRLQGESTYTLKKLLSLWFNGFTAFSIKPLRVSIFIGLMAAILSFILIIYAIIQKITDPNISVGWTSLISVISFFSGMILMVLGLIGEYIGRIYISLNKSPQYVIKKINNKEVLSNGYSQKN